MLDRLPTAVSQIESSEYYSFTCFFMCLLWSLCAFLLRCVLLHENLAMNTEFGNFWKVLQSYNRLSLHFLVHCIIFFVKTSSVIRTIISAMNIIRVCIYSSIFLLILLSIVIWKAYANIINYVLKNQSNDRHWHTMSYYRKFYKQLFLKAPLQYNLHSYIVHIQIALVWKFKQKRLTFPNN